MIRTNISIDEELSELVDKYCEKTGTTKSGLIQKLLKEELAGSRESATELLLQILTPYNKELMEDVASLKDMTITEYLNDVFSKILKAMIKKYTEEVVLGDASSSAVVEL